MNEWNINKQHSKNFNVVKFCISNNRDNLHVTKIYFSQCKHTQQKILIIQDYIFTFHYGKRTLISLLYIADLHSSTKYLSERSIN